MQYPVNRRDFVAAATAAGVALATHGAVAASPAADKPAILGGKKTRTQSFPAWPIMDAREEKSMLTTLRSGRWFRGNGTNVNKFEQSFARLSGAKHCVATNGGTTALIAALGALEIGPGDEVIVTPYTFIATINSILMHYALPVLVDIDPETYQIDPAKIEAAITDRTAAILPVHIGGNVADLDAILAVARKHKLPVIEDCCQAHVAQWRHRSVGTWGTVGCFSFQVSKNLCSGEGGAVLTDDNELAERIYAFHNNCRARTAINYNFSYTPTRAGNFRMTEFQGGLLMAQMTRLEQQSRTREENAAYLTELLRQVPGIKPCKMYAGCTRNNYHLYMFRYDAQKWAGLPRDKFVAALEAEGIPSSGGYSPVPWSAFLQKALGTRAARRVFPASVIDAWAGRCAVPQHERLCAEGVWFSQTLLLGTRADMDQVAAAIRKLHAHAGELAHAAARA
jgi:dTDP-4-amino-4,6-dideoxygalactose transaminase